MLQVALRRALPDWPAREPDNPYVAVFAPLLIDDEEDLRARAQGLWHTVQDKSLAPEVREFWFFERFRELTAKEIWEMLNVLTPIQETKAYQSIYAEGKVKGKTEGKAESLKRLLTRRFGPLPARAEQRIASTPRPSNNWTPGSTASSMPPASIDLLGHHAG